jgi:hypothetical protein
MKTKLSGVLLFLITAIVGAEVANADNHYDNRWAIGGNYGEAYPYKPDEFDDNYDHGQIYGASLQYGLSHDLSLVGSYANILLERDNVNDQDVEFQPVMLSFKYHPFTKGVVVPYLKAGAGVSMTREERPGTSDLHYDKFAAQGGLGLELFLNPGISVGAEGLYHHFVATPDQSPYRAVSISGFVKIAIASSSRSGERQ